MRAVEEGKDMVNQLKGPNLKIRPEEGKKAVGGELIRSLFDRQGRIRKSTFYLIFQLTARPGLTLIMGAASPLIASRAYVFLVTSTHKYTY